MKDILDIIKRQGKALSIEELQELTGITENELIPVIQGHMASFNLMQFKGKYALPKQMGLYVGRISCHVKGFAFLIQEDEDIFIA